VGNFSLKTKGIMLRRQRLPDYWYISGTTIQFINSHTWQFKRHIHSRNMLVSIMTHPPHNSCTHWAGILAEKSRGCTTWTGYFKCREVKTGFYRNKSMQTGSSGTLIGWKSGQTTFVPLWDRMEGAWLRTQLGLGKQIAKKTWFGLEK
jgi:hypothetical protein